MKFDVKYQNKSIGKIYDSSIVPFAQYCEEEGFPLTWNWEDKTIRIEPGLHTQKINMIMEENKNDQKETSFRSELMKGMKHALYETGIKVREQVTETRTNDNLHVKLSSPVLIDTLESPKIIVYYNLTPRHKFLVSFLQTYLENFEIHHQCKSKKNILSPPAISLDWEIPKHYNNAELKLLKEKLSFIFSMAISKYLSKINNKSAVAFSPSMLKTYLEVNKAPQTQNNKVSRSTLVTEKGSSSPSQKEQITPTKKEANAEVFFNYTVSPSTSKKQFITTGDLHIKNTGDIELLNPLICIKVKPTNLINLGGQILPPEMADTLGVQSSEGMKGWKFMDDDWFEKAQERGEYWIGAIDQLRIPPGERTSLPHFQLTIEQPDEKETAVIQSVVYFRDKNISFPSNNSITISF